MEKHFIIENGQKITMSTPTRQAVLAYAEKQEAVRKNKGDLLDDGDNEILECITYPSKKEMEEILDEYGLLSLDLGRMFNELAGMNVEVKLKPELITPELKTQHGKLIGYHIDGVDLVYKKLSRTEIKFWQREFAVKKEIPYKHLSSFADSHIVQQYREGYQKLAEQYPGIPLVIGQALLNQATAKLEADEKK